MLELGSASSIPADLLLGLAHNLPAEPSAAEPPEQEFAGLLRDLLGSAQHFRTPAEPPETRPADLSSETIPALLLAPVYMTALIPGQQIPGASESEGSPLQSSASTVLIAGYGPQTADESGTADPGSKFSEKVRPIGLEQIGVNKLSVAVEEASSLPQNPGPAADQGQAPLMPSTGTLAPRQNPGPAADQGQAPLMPSTGTLAPPQNPGPLADQGQAPLMPSIRTLVLPQDPGPSADQGQWLVAQGNGLSAQHIGPALDSQTGGSGARSEQPVIRLNPLDVAKIDLNKIAGISSERQNSTGEPIFAIVSQQSRFQDPRQGHSAAPRDSAGPGQIAGQSLLDPGTFFEQFHGAAASASVAPAQPVEIPAMPPAPVRTVALEIGEADSQVLVRISQFRGNLSLQFDAATPELRENLAADAPALLAALEREDYPVSALSFTNPMQTSPDSEDSRQQHSRYSRFQRRSAAGFVLNLDEGSEATE